MADDLQTTIEDAAAAPASVTADGQAVAAQKLPDLIAADQYLATKQAAGRKHMGLRFTKLVPPGARGGEPAC